MRGIDLGRAHIQPAGPVEAGSFTTITFTYTAGHPIDDTGYLKIAFRQPADFGTPQFGDPTAPNYCTVSTSGDCRLEPRWDQKGNTRPWPLSLHLKVMSGFLNTGEEIVVIFGNTTKGSPGWQMQTFCENTFEFKTLVDPIATYEFKELPESPTLSIVPGKPVRAVCLAPSQVITNKSFTYYLKLEDRWGNPTGKPLSLPHPGLSEPGVRTVAAKDEVTGLTAISNPVEVLPQKSPLQSYWADFHGQSEETVGTNTIEDYFAFAHDYGLLDISSHQGNDFQITDAFWKTINETTQKFYAPGSFVTFPGYEWSGNTPLGGDRNVHFATEDGQITRSGTDLLHGKYSAYEDSATAARLFQNLKKQKVAVFAFAHVGGRYSDISVHDPDIELAVEVHSAWGTFEWLVEEALERGYRIGICANSDDHKGRPGASYPGAKKFGSLGGLTCVLSQGLDRHHILEALKARHFYATTGNRSLLKVHLETGDGRSAIMGDVIQAGTATPYLNINIVGSGALESLAVRNGNAVIRTFRPYGTKDLGKRIKIEWSGAEVRGRARQVTWDGNLKICGNRILGATAINFWNANQPLKQPGNDRLSWQSITTGGLSGIIIEVAEAETGILEVATLQGKIEVAVNSLGVAPKIWDFGGLRKKIEVYRLPDRESPREMSCSLELSELHSGDNPIYIHMKQENGHMAWTSPIYLVK